MAKITKRKEKFDMKEEIQKIYETFLNVLEALSVPQLSEVIEKAIIVINNKKAKNENGHADLGFWDKDGEYKEDVQEISQQELNEHPQEGEIPIREIQFDEKGFELEFWQREAQVNKNWRIFYENKILKITPIVNKLRFNALNLVDVCECIQKISEILREEAQEDVSQ